MATKVKNDKSEPYYIFAVKPKQLKSSPILFYTFFPNKMVLYQ